MKKGKLVVLEGLDGSGKATQTEALSRRLEDEGFTCATMSFPRYQGNVFGELIGECLAGDRGDFLSLDPRITSILYAGDRAESKTELKQLMKQHHVVVLDRYMSSNQIHQGGRIGGVEERLEFFEWLDHLEHDLFGLPRPDRVIFLDVPTDISMQLVVNVSAASKKIYLNGKKDVYEVNRAYNVSSRENALLLLKRFSHWSKVDCTRDGVLLSREEIHKKVWKVVKKHVF